MRAHVLLLVVLGGCNQLLGVDDFSTDSGGDDDDDGGVLDAGAIDAMIAIDADPDQAATIEVTWAIVDGYVADGNSAGSCPPGAGEARVHVEGPTPTIVSFTCAAGTGTVPNRALGSYDVWLELRNGAGATVAQSPRFAAELDTADATESVVVTVDGYNGFFEASWDIDLAPCDPTESVSLLWTIPPSTGSEDLYDCDDGYTPAVVRSSALPIGSLTLATSLLNSGSQGVGAAEEQNVEILYGNQIISLGTLHIQRTQGIQ
jgi:hypothetical protein